MSMTLTQLRTILDDHLSTAPGQQYPALNLPATAFTPGSPLAAALSEYLDRGQLGIQLSAPLAEDATTITAIGAGVAAPFTGMVVNAVFSIEADEAALNLTADSYNPQTSADDWHFAQSFPSLAATLADRLPFTRVRLTLATGSAPEMTFAGSLHLQGALEVTAWLIGGATTLQLTGQITLQNRIVPPLTLADKLPLMNLSAPVGSAIQFGSYVGIQLTLALESKAVQPRPPGLAFDRSVLLLTTTLTFHLNGEDIPLPISCEFDDDPNLLYFVADTSRISQVGLNDLAQLVSGAALGDALPSSDWLKPGDVLQMSSIGLVVDPNQANGLVAVSIVVSVTRSWEIVSPDIITIEQPLSLNFTVLDPLESRQVHLALSGSVGLGPDATLDVFASYPNFTVAGSLEPGSNLDITAVAEHFLQTSVEFPALDLNYLEVYAEPSVSTYEFAAGVTTGFSLSVGIATLALESMYLSVVRALNEQGQVTTVAEIRASALLGPAELDVDWVIPGKFSLVGKVPQIDLRDLAQELTGGYMQLPAAFPDLALENSTVGILIESGNPGDQGATYDLSLSTTLEQLGSQTGLPTIGLGFELRKDSAGFGFVVGLAVPEGWSLADLFPDFADLLDKLTFRGSALILSSAAQLVAVPTNLAVPGLPATVGQGLTFVTTLSLAGNALGPLQQVFSSITGLTLLATINPTDLSQTQFVASIGSQPNAKGVVVWHGFNLTFMAKSETISLSTSLTITLQSNDGPPDLLNFIGAVVIPLNPTEASVTFALAMVGDWANPFGIPQLDILGVGINVTASASGFSIGLAGSIEIGDPKQNDQVIFLVGAQILDGEAPGALIASVKSSPQEDGGVTLPQLVQGFTSLDLTWVPLIQDIALKELTCYIVDNPTGFSDPLDPKHIYPPGFTVRADMIFFGVEAKVDIEVLADKGVKASGSLSEVVQLGNVLVISDASGTQGAHALLDTTALSGPSSNGQYLNVSGLVSLFNVASAQVTAYIKNNVFSFDLDYEVANIEKFTMHCSLNGLTSFAAGAQVNFSLSNFSVELNADGLDLGTLTFPTLAIAAGLDLTLNTTLFELDVAASFNFRGEPLGFSYTISESFSDLGQLVEKTASQLASEGWAVFKPAFNSAQTFFAALGYELTSLGDDFGLLLNQTYHLSIGQAIALFAGVNYSLADYVWILARGYQAGAEVIAFALFSAGYTALQITDALANGLKIASDVAAQILYDLGYGAGEIIMLLIKFFNDSTDQATAIVNAILNRANSVCGATAFAEAINAPADDLDDLRQVRADLQNCPPGSKGRWYLDLYSEYSPIVHRLITTDPDVKAHIAADNGQEIWDAILAAFRSAQGGNPLPFPGGDMQDRALDILAVMMQKDDGLANAINDVWPDIQSYEGLTYPQFLVAAQAPHQNSASLTENG